MSSASRIVVFKKPIQIEICGRCAAEILTKLTGFNFKTAWVQKRIARHDDRISRVEDFEGADERKGGVIEKTYRNGTQNSWQLAVINERKFNAWYDILTTQISCQFVCFNDFNKQIWPLKTAECLFGNVSGTLRLFNGFSIGLKRLSDKNYANNSHYETEPCGYSGRKGPLCHIPLGLKIAFGAPLFRSPHHSASMPALVGGGLRARPGEISLAHNGVLFLDELPEFAAQALDSLRQPLETGEVAIARANHRITYPARFMLVAAMNPCRCGRASDPGFACKRGPNARCAAEYQARLSGPLLDRIDLHIEVPPVTAADLILPPPSEGSHEVAARVARARDTQAGRYAALGLANVHTNAQAAGPVLE